MGQQFRLGSAHWLFCCLTWDYSCGCSYGQLTKVGWSKIALFTHLAVSADCQQKWLSSPCSLCSRLAQAHLHYGLRVPTTAKRARLIHECAWSFWSCGVRMLGFANSCWPGQVTRTRLDSRDGEISSTFDGESGKVALQSIQGGIITAVFANHLPQSILRCRIEVGRELDAQLTWER